MLRARAIARGASAFGPNAPMRTMRQRDRGAMRNRTMGYGVMEDGTLGQ